MQTVDDVAASLRRQLRVRCARPSYLEGCESMQRVHISPHLGTKPVTEVKTAHVEATAAAMLDSGLAPKTVRNVLTFLHSVFEHAIDRGLMSENPVRRATRPGRRRPGDSNPDLQFLSVEELDSVIRAIPDDVVLRTAKPSRKGRPGPAPPPPPDVLGPVLRVVILAAATTGLRQSELLGLRWRDVDWTIQRIRVRNAFVRGEHSTDGKSDLSTRRSVPMADRLAGELDRWSRATAYGHDDDFVFAHPQSGKPLDRSKVTKRFKAACTAAGVRPVRFHDLRHTFGTRLAATGQPIRSIQEFLGHADVKTTQIYMHYAPSEREVAMVNEAFPTRATGIKLSETAECSEQEIPANRTDRN
ncbi:MAG: tyrosine-type recombinase/integrase [Solirubrobacteraceae bacterium]